MTVDEAIVLLTTISKSHEGGGDFRLVQWSVRWGEWCDVDWMMPRAMEGTVEVEMEH